MSQNEIKDKRELPQERLATTDEKGHRVYLYPADVSGRYHSRKKVIQIVLMFLFLVLPWINIGSAPAILLDIPNRRFSIFGLTFWAHDGPLLFLVLGGAATTIAWMTVIWGRVWCGYACPETVFIESVFRRIEKWIEGDSTTRKRRDHEPLTIDWAIRKSLKWLTFTLVSIVIAHSFLAYFIGAERLAQMSIQSPLKNVTEFSWMLAITALVLFAFGWFREQFCIIMCPYGRLQSVFMDRHSQIITYDSKRGEPRRGLNSQKNITGDCINCYRCVQVCPTGIDIRRGSQQLECVACTACIDACDDVMKRISKPLGLIRYDSEIGLTGKKPNWIRPRTVIISAILAAFAVVLTTLVLTRKPVSVALLRAKELPYQIINDSNSSKAEIINHFRAELGNLGFTQANIKIELDPNDTRKIEIISATNPIQLEAGQQNKLDFFVKFPKEILNTGRTDLILYIKSTLANKIDIQRQELPLVGPF